MIALLCSLLLTAVLQAQDAPRPNVLIFLVDDLGWQDCSVPMSGTRTELNARYRTPHLARLAAQGTVFENGYASAPVCTPTRTSLLTGLSPGATGITYWILHGDRDTSRKHPRLRPPRWRLEGLGPQDVTLPALLRGAGYETIHVGKAHLGAHGTPGADPRRLGFSRNIAGHASGAPASYLARHGFRRPNGQDSVWSVPGLERWHGSDRYLTDVLCEEALGALADARATERPWFLHFAPYAVHTPITAHPGLIAHYADLPRREAAYASMIEAVDRALGRLLDDLERHGEMERTLIVFTSDNGGLSAGARDGEKHTHNRPARSGKGSAYDGGLRVPWVIRRPGQRQARRSKTPIVTHDLFPTVLATCGVSIPEQHARRVEGEDLGALLRGEAVPALEGRSLYWHQPHQWGLQGPGIEPFSAVRRGRHKLVYFHADRRLELYDLRADPGESRDLAPLRPALRRSLAEDLSAWAERVGATMSIEISSGQGVALPRAIVAR